MIMRAKEMEQKATTPQMTLEEYKKKVMDLLMPKSGNTTKTDLVRSLETMSEDAWESYMKEFSPEEAACGFRMSLI